MDNLNTITFCKEDYESENKMWSDIALTLKILSRQYIAVFRCEPGMGIYEIDYNYADPALGDLLPIWATLEERELIKDSRRQS